jgi:hypothetical protein
MMQLCLFSETDTKIFYISIVFLEDEVFIVEKKVAEKVHRIVVIVGTHKEI